MRLIDADVLRAVKFHALPYTHIHALGAEPQSYEMGWNDAVDAIMDCAPTVDAVEVVRCKDCLFFRRYGFRRQYTCARFDCHVPKDGYCCWAERREDEAD